jgi:hypothetical protein
MDAMRSPFPGMDPYLEQFWPEVHGKLVPYSTDELNAHLPEDLAATMQERLAIESEDQISAYIPDLRVNETEEEAEVSDTRNGGNTQVATAFRLITRSEPLKEQFIHLIETGSNRLISVIEFLSPSNKVGEGLSDFRKKRRKLLASGVNFIEIDLVRSGDWRALLRPHLCPRKGIAPYRFTIRMPSDPGAVHFQPISLRQPLPNVPIPLRQGETPATLPLQALLDQTYANGRYHRRINYSEPPIPPLDEIDAAWARDRIKSI